MSKNLQSPTKLTEFAPLDPEEDAQDGVGQLISRFFKFGKTSGGKCDESAVLVENASSDDLSHASLQSWAMLDKEIEVNDSNVGIVYNVSAAEGRTFPSVLKRISNLLALKRSSFQVYSDSKFKQYWMPDSVSKECYECSEKFTTFRRRHHCRVCGQIFCSACCNQQIPGKIFGCTGDLRVCTYCCKVVLSYLESNDIGSVLSADLKALQENLQSKYGDPSVTPNVKALSPNVSVSDLAVDCLTSVKRKISVGYQEEKFASGRETDSYLTVEEKCKAFQNSTSLRNLYEEICRPNSGIALRKQRYRLRTYYNTFFGSELVDWLIYQQKANTRIQAAAFCQALLEGGYVVCLMDSTRFIDGNACYKLEVIAVSNSATNLNPQVVDTSLALGEPSWVQCIPQEVSIEESESESCNGNLLESVKTSSSYTLNLNVAANTVYLSRPAVSSPNSADDSSDSSITNARKESVLIRTSEQYEFVPESGWHKASLLRERNGEEEAYKLLSSTYDQHETSLIRQLLSVQGLNMSWTDTITSLVRDIVDVIRPDMKHNAEDLDIRNYVQFKKLSGGQRADCQLVRGIVFSKNVAHKAMSIRLENPKILLLMCPIVYQRTEGRYMSLDPVLMQEQQYLRHAADRILALKPNIVLVNRNISRLAQDILLQRGVTIVLNVKQRVLERLSRCTDADLVSSIDARISAPHLGTCRHFYLKSFDIDKGGCKTLMFFEGLPQAHLGATVLLRGASKLELTEVKAAASFMLFASYNWRLEKSFLMDEFAYPRVTKDEFFDDSKENSPVSPVVDAKVSSRSRRKLRNSSEWFASFDSEAEFCNSHKQEAKNKCEEKKSLSEPIQDFSDPLHSYNADGAPKDNCIQMLSVADLPFSNQFRKALDDSIICVSPYLVFSVPYLETDNGRKCKLRSYFPAEMYFSAQFSNTTKKKICREQTTIEHCKNDKNMKPPHNFITTPIYANIDSNEVQARLANFRACGGRLAKQSLLIVQPIETSFLKDKEDSEEISDVLNPRSHQQLAVLLCSFNKESTNAPAFCVNPWFLCINITCSGRSVVTMSFYGQNDIPLGCFLMRYCFSSTYYCQSKCETPMLKHVRRFVHYNGCVSVFLGHMDNLSADDCISMWSVCSRCQRVSPMVKMSIDTWSFSFAKYLELRFHGGLYSRRGDAQCTHSLHHDHLQYFSYQNIVTTFKYNSIDLWEISLPSRVISIYSNMNKLQLELIEENKSLALKGHEIYSVIQEKLAVLLGDEDAVQAFKQLLAKDLQLFKQRIEEAQLKLTSPTIANISLEMLEKLDKMWRIQDGIVRIKRLIVETVDQWNAKLSEGASHKKDDKKRDKTNSQELDSPNLSDYKGSEASDIENSFVDEPVNNAAIPTKNRSLDKPDDDDVVFAYKGHQRSQSDGTVLTQLEEPADNKKENDKKASKGRFSMFSTIQYVPISSPFSNQEHYTLPVGVYGPLAVYESEHSSVVAYALNSFEYKKQYEELINKKVVEQMPSPLIKRRNTSEKDKADAELTQSTEKPHAIKSFFRSKDNKTDLLSLTTSGAVEGSQQPSDSPPSGKVDDWKTNSIQVQFEDNHCKFYCDIFQPEKFSALRKAILPIGEEAYMRSLSRCVQWNARGGKSGSTFAKSLDDRFIIKGMSQKEIQLFLESAHNYFTYMSKCLSTGQPTLLGKIVGVYQIVFKNSATNHSMRTYLLIMENLFYNRVVTQKFDLKGSVRNRLVNTDNQDGEIVLLDENLLKMTCENPLYIHPHSKAVLMAAIQSDTEFLSNQCVMDYSLLVGLDTDRKELVLGIIDYIRTFTWDKKLETIVKKTGILGGQGKLPTIMPPQEYQKRFIEAMHRYFLEVPDPWAGMDKGLET